jgi:hypothetical protein
VQVQEFEEEAVQMEERPEETTIDEEQDVESHKHHAPQAGQNVGKEEDDDVEGHGPHVGAPHVGAPHVGREDEDDDVEAHGPQVGAPQVGKPQVG